MIKKITSKLLALGLVIGITSSVVTPVAANAATKSTKSYNTTVTKPNSQIQTDGLKSKAVEKAAKWLAAKVGSKSVSEITDYLFDWKDNLEEGCENYLIDECGWPHWAAHSAVKTADFLFL